VCRLDGQPACTAGGCTVTNPGRPVCAIHDGDVGSCPSGFGAPTRITAPEQVVDHRSCACDCTASGSCTSASLTLYKEGGCTGEGKPLTAQFTCTPTADNDLSLLFQAMASAPTCAAKNTAPPVNDDLSSSAWLTLCCPTP
jgi:hypothetical protein